MKKILILFGILDLFTVIKAFNKIYRMIFNQEFSFLAIIILLIYASLIVSGYNLIRQNRLGLWISYLQFPFRLIFSILSFGFLMILNKWNVDNNITFWYLLTGLLIVMEISRLVITIMIHKKHIK